MNSIRGGGVTCRWGPLCLGTGQVIHTSGSSGAWLHAGPRLQGQCLVGMLGREKGGECVQTSLPLTLAGPRVLPRLQRAKELALVRWGAAGWLDAPPRWSRGWVSPGQLPGFAGCVSAARPSSGCRPEMGAMAEWGLRLHLPRPRLLQHIQRSSGWLWAPGPRRDGDSAPL